jgi:hypothetical protein
VPRGDPGVRGTRFANPATELAAVPQRIHGALPDAERVRLAPCAHAPWPDAPGPDFAAIDRSVGVRRGPGRRFAAPDRAVLPSVRIRGPGSDRAESAGRRGPPRTVRGTARGSIRGAGKGIVGPRRIRNPSHRTGPGRRREAQVPTAKPHAAGGTP